MTSIRKRAVAGGIAWAATVTFAGSYMLGSYLDIQTQRRFDNLLVARHNQAVVALANSGGEPQAITDLLGDPIYARPFSGEYWQAEAADGTVVVSRSLTDRLLPEVPGTGGEVRLRTLPGPGADYLRIASQEITLENGDKWVLSVGSTLHSLVRDRLELKQRMNIAFALTGLFAIIGAVTVVMFILRPLSKLRKDVIERWENAGAMPIDEYPEEVQPLVNDINLLLERNREIIKRSRQQTADLAHALKTPSAIMRNELEALESKGASAAASLEALNRLDAQLNRSFARMKSEQEGLSEKSMTALDTSLGRMARAFTSLAKNRDRRLDLALTKGLTARINQSDLEEIVGNLMDNALKWSETAISLTSEQIGQQIIISIEDDGPGIPQKDRELAMSSGQRLDTSKPGTGLGLAIVRDIVAAYTGKLEILESEGLGGARLRVTLPADSKSRPIFVNAA